MVRRILFADGISWVARIRLPPLPAAFGDGELLDVASILKVEVSSLQFLRGQNLDPSSGSACLQYRFNRRCWSPNCERKKCGVRQYGTPDQDRMFRQQMASIQVTLAPFTFDQIGSLYRDEQTSDFFIGPEVETGKGPWASSLDYYTDVADHALRTYVGSAEPDVQECCSFANPILFKYLISLYGHRLEPEPPGHVETNPAAIDRIRMTRPRLKEYKDLVEIAEVRMGIGKEGNTPIASLMLSDAASVFQGLVRYGGHQKHVNDEGIEAYLTLLRGHIKSGGCGDS
ncbi:Uncharacterized protein TCAP_05683 [Tolypocladium capitatum]|uniref:Uncharacterized protein n=1 Tax=Tolypocladium capitatum TaxID=45235 RepID=A0A2K3QA10_9HYPO|nr:Uncharacterized protein TCAP_05683 [Tolypocladium capitatum]